jgi:glyoxylase-like metal-dependent hydrolase (beta-lactamase superfamily II)
VLTHLHFDHAGGLCGLPNVTVVVQAQEWAQLADQRLVASGAINPDDVELGHERLEPDGDHDLFGDGAIVCLLTAGHTAGHQSVRVRAFDGTYVLCGDCCYLRRTLTNEHLPPFAWDRQRQVDSIRMLAAEQRNGATLLFGHDPDQAERIAAEGLHPGV